MSFIVNGGNKLFGEVEIDSAKNCVLALIAAAVAVDGITIIKNCKPIGDVLVMLEIVNKLGCSAFFDDGDIVIDARGLNCSKIDSELSAKMRGSVLLAGALAGRLKKAEVAYPGGCSIGARPLDIHIEGFRSLGVKAECEENITLDASFAKCGEVNFRYPSVGATENLLIFAALCEGETVIRNVAVEPEVVALEKFLRDAGANVDGIGQTEVKIRGVKRLSGIKVNPIPDRIETATFLLACCATGGKVKLNNTCFYHLFALNRILQKQWTLKCLSDSMEICVDRQPMSFGKIKTAPYPAFATDMQSLVLSVACIARGQTEIEEKVFENRMANCSQLVKMGADLKVDANAVTINGVKNLTGAVVEAKDLRSGAGLLIAALCAKGQSTVEGGKHVRRGYFHLEQKLQSLGADVVYV